MEVDVDAVDVICAEEDIVIVGVKNDAIAVDVYVVVIFGAFAAFQRQSYVVPGVEGYNYILDRDIDLLFAFKAGYIWR